MSSSPLPRAEESPSGTPDAHAPPIPVDGAASSSTPCQPHGQDRSGFLSLTAEPTHRSKPPGRGKLQKAAIQARKIIDEPIDSTTRRFASKPRPSTPLERQKDGPASSTEPSDGSSSK